jgi:pimeloyl-ACP methyl ester carboxylesterase
MGKPGSTASYYLGYMAYAMRARAPSFQPSDMLTGEALKHYAEVTTKGCWNYAYAAFIHAPVGPVLKPGWDQTAAAQRFFKENELGRAPVSGPLLVIGGEADETVPFGPLRAMAKYACGNGSALTFRSYPGLDHDPTMDQSTPDQLAWVGDRFAGKPSVNNCASLTN